MTRQYKIMNIESIRKYNMNQINYLYDVVRQALSQKTASDIMIGTSP